jgi:RNA polymerase sigma-70 factor, ECF subfamily
MQDVCTNAEMVALLKNAQCGDPAAFDRLYSLYADKIFRYLYARSGQREVAEDLTADVFVRLIQVLPRFRVNSARPVASFSAWLYRIAANLLLDQYRRQRYRNHADLAEHHELPSPEPSPHDGVAADENCQALMQAIDHLNEDQQMVLLCRFAENLSVQDVAEVMGKTEGAIKALQHRALLNLRRILAYEPGHSGPKIGNG